MPKWETVLVEPSHLTKQGKTKGKRKEIHFNYTFEIRLRSLKDARKLALVITKRILFLTSGLQRTEVKKTFKNGYTEKKYMDELIKYDQVDAFLKILDVNPIKYLK